MMQEFMDWIEYGVDCYIDMISGERVAILIKKLKLELEKQINLYLWKMISFFEIIKSFIKEAGFKGIIDIYI